MTTMTGRTALQTLRLSNPGLMCDADGNEVWVFGSHLVSVHHAEIAYVQALASAAYMARLFGEDHVSVPRNREQAAQVAAAIAVKQGVTVDVVEKRLARRVKNAVAFDAPKYPAPKPSL